MRWLLVPDRPVWVFHETDDLMGFLSILFPTEWRERKKTTTTTYPVSRRSADRVYHLPVGPSTKQNWRSPTRRGVQRNLRPPPRVANVKHLWDAVEHSIHGVMRRRDAIRPRRSWSRISKEGFPNILWNLRAAKSWGFNYNRYYLLHLFVRRITQKKQQLPNWFSIKLGLRDGAKERTHYIFVQLWIAPTFIN